MKTTFLPAETKNKPDRFAGKPFVILGGKIRHVGPSTSVGALYPVLIGGSKKQFDAAKKGNKAEKIME
ncbi:MAG TPA: hypothetical protein PLO51_05730 [Candidatus Micrarchaeota archaeon]|nr:hypothetical protein [Candidatus Micrarchaeota archaeon]